MKSKAPLSCASAESPGFILDDLRRFKVRVAWARRRSKRCSGKPAVTLIFRCAFDTAFLPNPP